MPQKQLRKKLLNSDTNIAQGQKVEQPEEEDIPSPDEIEKNQANARKYIHALNEQTKADESAQRIETQPQAAEPDEPRAMETTKPEAQRNAHEIAAAGSIVPVGGVRPQPNNPSREEGSVIVAKALAEQLGTSPELKAQMRIDERKMAVLTDGTLAALSHFSYRYTYDGVRYWGHVTEWWLTGSQGIGGLGRRHILQALANTSGIQSIEKAEKPNAVARNIWDRNWRKKAEEQGKVPED